MPNAFKLDGSIINRVLQLSIGYYKSSTNKEEENFADSDAVLGGIQLTKRTKYHKNYELQAPIKI